MIEQITGAMPLSELRFHHAEGPVWDVQRNRLLFVDMLNGDLGAIDFSDPVGEPHVTMRHIDDVLAFIRPRTQGGWLAASADSLLVLDEDFSLESSLTVFSNPLVRFNEGGCDASGVLYAGTMSYDKTPGAGMLYRIDAARRPEVLLGDVTISNGLAPRPGSDDLYYIDSATRRVDVMTVGETVIREPFVSFEPGAGTPDGLTVDSEGGVWVALSGAGRVRRIDRYGLPTHEVVLPTTQVSSCAFGGIGLSTLFITTSQIGSSRLDPFAGAVFAVETPFLGTEVIPTIV